MSQTFDHRVIGTPPFLWVRLIDFHGRILGSGETEAEARADAERQRKRKEDRDGRR